MAELAISFLVSNITERLAEFLINESASTLSEVVREVEWIERELRLMQAFLEHIERDGQGQANEWAEKLKDVAREAEDAIETFILNSVERRRGGLLAWVDRYKVRKELDRISEKMRQISQPNIGVVVETPASSSNALVSAAPAVEKLSCILNENLVTFPGVIKMVKQVRDEVAVLHNIMLGLESAEEESSERERVWVEQVKGVCDSTAQVAGDFIHRSGKWPKLKCVCQIRLKNKMKYITTLIADALHRKVTYGVREEDDGDRRKLRSFFVPPVSLKQMILHKFSFLNFYTIFWSKPSADLLPYFLPKLVCVVILMLYLQRKSIVRLWKANKKKEKLLKRAAQTIFLDASIDIVIFVVALGVAPSWGKLLLGIGSIIGGVLLWAVPLWWSTGPWIRISSQSKKI